MRRAYGFTIVELLIVIVVIGILAALSYVGYATMSDRANDAIMDDAASQVARAIQTWVVDGGNLKRGNSGSTLPIENGLCPDGGGQGFVGASSPGPDYRCTTADMLVAAGLLPADFIVSLPSNPYFGTSPANGKHSLMIYNCGGDASKWMLFWTLRRPSASDTDNLYNTMIQCGRTDPPNQQIVKSWGMRAVRIINI